MEKSVHVKLGEARAVALNALVQRNEARAALKSALAYARAMATTLREAGELVRAEEWDDFVREFET